MPEEAKKPFSDPLERQRRFPEAAPIFGFAPVSLAEAIADGLIVVDTNALLIPYTTSKASLDQIKNVYKKLTSEKRLRIPGQVAREYADQRAEKLKLIFQQLSQKRNTNLTLSQYPLLEGIENYAELQKLESETSSKLREYRETIAKLLSTIEQWQWNDPVSLIYRELFIPEVFVDPEVSREKILEELRYRQEHRIPPGYKDAKNEHSGIGDFLIWKTILHVGSTENKHVVFVTADAKSDWRYQAENQGLYPRFELLDEYRRASNNMSIHIIDFAEFLESLGVPAPVVAEVKKEELVAKKETEHSTRGSLRGFLYENSVCDWVRKMHPELPVLQGVNGWPDVTIPGLKGFEVMATMQQPNIFLVLDEFHEKASRYRQVPAPEGISLVLVFPDIVQSDFFTRRMNHLRNNNYLLESAGGTDVIWGYIASDGGFRERSKMRLLQNGSSNREAMGNVVEN